MIAKPQIAKPEVVEHLMLYNVSWEAYERLLEAFGDRRLRHTYNDGVLEIMSPSRYHEAIKRFLAQVVETVSFQLNIPIRCAGSTTLRKPLLAKGLEPDECYYIQNAKSIKMFAEVDKENDPPPDLAIEVNITHKDLNRDTVYAALQVPELWHYDFDDDLTRIFVLENGTYVPKQNSLALPIVNLDSLQTLLTSARLHDDDDHRTVREVQAWLKEIGLAKP